MKFHGNVGFGVSTETSPGVWEDGVVERPYFGDVIRNARLLHAGENLNRDLSVSNTISIVADAHAREQFFAIKYVVWEGVRWTVTNIAVQSPRLIFQLGELYNGPIPA